MRIVFCEKSHPETAVLLHAAQHEKERRKMKRNSEEKSKEPPSISRKEKQNQKINPTSRHCTPKIISPQSPNPISVQTLAKNFL